MDRKMIKKRSGLDSSPINVYYRPTKPKTDHPKVKVLKKGQMISGVYEHTFVDKEFNTETFLINTETEGKITLKGGRGLSADMAGIPRGTYVEITFQGLGKAKPGKRPPFLFEVAHEEFDAKVAAAKKKTEDARKAEALSEESALDEVDDSADEEDLTF